MLVGCMKVAVPLTPKFPDAPEQIKKPCEELTEVAKTASLSDFTKTVVNNYIKYHDCKANNKAWIDWYNEQKTIYESVTKN
jgi:hypothetical protein